MRCTLRSNATRNYPSFRVHTRTKSGRTLVASGAVFFFCSPFPVYAASSFSKQPLKSSFRVYVYADSDLRFTIHRFLYDGNRINDEDTPSTLDMDDGGACLSLLYPLCLIGSNQLNLTDTIDVMVERMSYFASSAFLSLMFRLIFFARGGRVPAALMPPIFSVPALSIVFVAIPVTRITRTSVHPANHLCLLPAQYLVFSDGSIRVSTMYHPSCISST